MKNKIIHSSQSYANTHSSTAKLFFSSFSINRLQELLLGSSKCATDNGTKRPKLLFQRLNTITPLAEMLATFYRSKWV